MTIIDVKDKQDEIRITERKTVFDSGREIHTVDLNVNGATVSMRIHKVPVFPLGTFDENQPEIHIHNVEKLCPRAGVTVFHLNETKITKKLQKLPKHKSNSTRFTVRRDES